MVEIYTRIDWVNKKDGQTTPLGATNLNKMDAAISEMDKRIVELDAVKADKLTVNTMLADCEYDEETGIVKLTRKNGEQIIFDLNIEKIPVAFALSESGVLTMTTEDGTEWTADIGAMIPVLTFNNSDTVNVIVTGSGKNKTYSFEVKDGSITEDKLRPDYLAEIKVESSKAVASATNAATSEHNAAESAKTAQECKEQAGKTVENLVPAWARQESKPEYTAVEVGADPAGTADAAVEQLGAEVFKSYRGELENINTAPSAVKSGCYKVFNTGVIYDLLLCFNSTAGSATALQVLLSYDLKKCLIRPAINNGSWGPWRPLAFADDFPTAMTGATADADGTSGLVPVPLKGDQNKFLRADGTWVAPPESGGGNAGALSACFAYAVCEDAGNIAAKTATIQNDPNWELKVGSVVAVKYSNINTASKLKIKLNINDTGAKQIYYSTGVLDNDLGCNNAVATLKNQIVVYMYDGTYWAYVGHGEDSNDKYYTMNGATDSADGAYGLVPRPTAGDNTKFLRGDGTWASPSATEYSVNMIGSKTSTDSIVVSDPGIYTIVVNKYGTSAPIGIYQYAYTYDDSDTFAGKTANVTAAMSSTHGTVAVSTNDAGLKITSAKGYEFTITYRAF